jgi:hypothetical protein
MTIKGFQASKGLLAVEGFTVFVLFLLFGFSVGSAQTPCDSYAAFAYAEELAEDVVKEELNYWAPLDFSAIVTHCHYDVYDAVTEFSVFTDWFAYNGEEYFQMNLTLTFRDTKIYWAIPEANAAVWEHINATDVTLDFLELLLIATSE